MLLLVSVKGTFKSAKVMSEQVYFSVEQTNWLRGIAIFMVVLCHYYPMLGMTYSDGLISFSMNIGYLGVAVFLLLSGYATMISKINKHNYLHHYIPKRLLRLYVPFIVVFVLYFVLEWVFRGEFIVRYLYSVPIMSLPDTPNWYLKVQLCLYILFFISAKLFKKNCSIIISTSIICLLYIIVGYIINIDAFWYETVLAFPLGMLVACVKDKLFLFIRKNRIISIVLSLFILFVCFFPYFKWGGIIFEIVFIFGFVQFIICVCAFICGNMKLLKHIGKCSLELYLSHMVIIFVFKQLFVLQNYSILINILLLLVYLASSVLLSMIVHLMCNKVIHKLSKKHS